MDIEYCKLIHARCAEGYWQESGDLILNLLKSERKCDNASHGIKLAQQLFQYALDNELYLQAATLQWGAEMFNTEPESTARVFKALQSDSRVLLQGASSMSKTYAAGAYYLLDYLRDPQFTTVKLAAINEDHLKKNLFAHVVALYRACAIPSQHKIIIQDAALWMGIKEAGLEFGISGLAFKQSQETSGQFKGYKAKPVRKKKHPKFGFHSRLRVLGDEGQNWPNGPFKDFNSLVASITGTDIIKITVAYNPESIGQHVVQLAEPDQGWRLDELDTLYDWVSKSGWRVCRLDAALCENVVQRRVVYPGLQTFEGYLSYLKAGGDNSPNYLCFGRGFPPVGGSVDVIIPPAWPQEARGEATFLETPVNCAAVDLAFMGKDSAQMAVGRWGLASGYRDQFGKFQSFTDRLDISRKKPRHVLQIDQLLPMAKHDNTVQMSEEIMARCKAIQIKPEWVAVDKMQPVSEPVLTPSGWVEIGKIKKGDLVVGSDGNATIVTGVFPQKDRRVVRVSFTDGSWTRCGPEHLWRVQDARTGIWKTLTTKCLRDDAKKKGQWRVPLISAPVHAETKILPIEPYLLGCLLGDGNLRENHVRFSNIDNEILGYVSNLLPLGVKLVHTDRCNYQLVVEKKQCPITGRFISCNPLVNSLRELGLAGKRSHEKFIPKIYTQSSPSQKLEILRGLMDTDGFCQKGGAGIRLCSARMIAEIAELSESLGASVRYTTHKTSCKGKPGRVAHKLTIAMPAGVNPFKLKRKARNVNRRFDIKHRIVAGFDDLPDEDSVCIRVAAEDHLYVTRHHIVTHNTGIGFGVHSHLVKVWGAVFGVSWSEKATERKILSEDIEGADKQCDGVMSEMWWAFRQWINPACRAILINPIIPGSIIQTQMTTRRYKNGGKGIKVEKKEEYMARNANQSPDESDALVMLVHVVRKNSDTIPGLVEHQLPGKEINGKSQLRFISVKDMAYSPDPDVISADGED